MAVLDDDMATAHDLTKKVTILIKQDGDAESPRTAGDNVGTMACYHRRYDLGDKGGAQALHDDLYDALTDALHKRRPALASKGYNAHDALLPCPRSCKWHVGHEEPCPICRGWVQVDNPYYIASTDAEDVADALESYRRFEDDVPYHKRLLLVPLYLYDHSGLTISTGSFGDRWDSGQAGWIFLTYQEVMDNWGWKRLTPARLKQVEDFLKSEVAEYDLYLTGNVWGFEVWQHEDTESPEDGELLDSCWGFFGDPDDPEENGMAEHWADEWKDAERKVMYG